MATEYKMVNTEALEREFERLTKQVRPAKSFGPGLFSAHQKLAQVTPTIFEYVDKGEHDIHALIGVRADNGKPSVRYYDIGEKPKVSSEKIQDMARKFIQACQKSQDWHNYFNDHRATELKAYAAWTEAEVETRPLNPPVSKPKATVEERLADGKRFVETTTVEPTLISTPGKP
jgi:hypothetical protein